MKVSKCIDLYTDGSYKGKINRGGYAAYIPNEETVICGYLDNTTNNQMELQAVISGLRHIQDKSVSINVYTDSQYVCNGVNKWIKEWNKNNWITKDKQEVKNKELWLDLQKEISNYKKVKCYWVKGHNNNRNNELCDAFATAVTKCKG